MIRSGEINTQTFTQDLEKIFGSDYKDEQDLASKIYVYVAKGNSGGQELHCMKKGFINGLWLKIFHKKEDYSLEEDHILRKQLGTEKPQLGLNPSPASLDTITQSIFDKIFNKYDLQHKYRDDLERLKTEFEVTRDVKNGDELLKKLSTLYKDVSELKIGEASNSERKKLQNEIINVKVSVFRNEFELIERNYNKKKPWDKEDYASQLQSLSKEINTSMKGHPENNAKRKLEDDINILWNKMKGIRK